MPVVHQGVMFLIRMWLPFLFSQNALLCCHKSFFLSLCRRLSLQMSLALYWLFAFSPPPPFFHVFQWYGVLLSCYSESEVVGPSGIGSKNSLAHVFWSYISQAGLLSNTQVSTISGRMFTISRGVFDQSPSGWYGVLLEPTMFQLVVSWMNSWFSNSKLRV